MVRMPVIASHVRHGRLERFLRSWGPVPDAELAKAHHIFRSRDVPRRTTLVRAGDIYQQVVFVVSGLVRIYDLNESGIERTKAFRGEDQLACVFSAVAQREPSRSFIVTVEDSQTLVASRQAFEELTAGHPVWPGIIGAIVTSLYVEEERRHSELLMDDAPTRYRNFLTREPELAARLTQRLIASYIGITPVALSRIARKFRNVDRG
jgi:CRP-like cAMP-binding protein